jgi:ABC-type polysaccharide/polyol phosphate transport system ATPase subunit
MMGLTKNKIEEIIDDIIDFVDIGDFIEMPVRTYSSGMRARLGFAIAIQSDKDIVLIDEIMGAGDAAFREKAEAEINRIMGERTVILVSHNMSTVEKFSGRIIWLDRGLMAAMGDPKEVIEQYLKASKVKRRPVSEELPDVA